MTGRGRPATRASRTRGRVIAVAVLAALALGLYLAADSVLAWLRVTLHGR